MSEFDKDREAEAKATPGPWWASEGDEQKHAMYSTSETIISTYDLCDKDGAGIERCEDARFIAHARNRFIPLLDKIAEQEQTIAGRDGIIAACMKRIAELEAEIERFKTQASK